MRAHSNNSLYKKPIGLGIFGNMECWHRQGLPKIFWLPPIISGMGKGMDFKLAGTFTQSIRTKAH